MTAIKKMSNKVSGPIDEQHSCFSGISCNAEKNLGGSGPSVQQNQMFFLSKKTNFKI